VKGGSASANEADVNSRIKATTNRFMASSSLAAQAFQDRRLAAS
jgi:hypothetical protein